MVFSEVVKKVIWLHGLLQNFEVVQKRISVYFGSQSVITQLKIKLITYI